MALTGAECVDDAIATIRDKEVLKDLAREIKSFMMDFKAKKYWTGLRKVYVNAGKWVYAVKKGYFDPSGYSLWHEKPMDGQDCGSVSEDTDYKVTALKCQASFNYICEKSDEPCDRNKFPYINSHGLCVGVSTDMNEPMANEAGDICMTADGTLLALKDEDIQKKIIPAVRNSNFTGGIFVGLKKTASGEWLYADGTAPPDDMWDEDDPREWDCGALKVENDWSLKLHTLSCSSSMAVLCEQREKQILPML